MAESLKRIAERLDDNNTSKVERVQRRAFTDLLNKLPLPNSATALSISTGDGCWDLLAFENEPRIASIDATDVVPNPVNTEDQALLNTEGIWNFTQVDKEAVLPFKDGDYDLVYHHDVLEHVQKPYLFVKEQYRVLKSGGWLILSTPNLFRPANVAKLLIGNLSFPYKIGYTKGIGDYIHTKEYTANDIILLLEEAGFVKVSIESLYLGLPILNINVADYPKGKVTSSFCHYLVATAHKI